MNTVNSKLYQLIKGKVGPKQLERIIGGSLYRGLLNFQKYLSTGAIEIDYEKLLLNILGKDVLMNQDFLNFFIDNVLIDSAIRTISADLKIPYSNNHKTREIILQKSKNTIAKSIIKLLELNSIDFISDTKIEPIKPNEINIQPDPNNCLALHGYQKNIKNEIVQNLLHKPKARMLIHMPTGSGKTKTCVEAIIDFLRTRPFDEGLVIWFSHSNELCAQSYFSLIESWKFRGDFPLPVIRIFGKHNAASEVINVKKGVFFIGFQKFNSILKSKSRDAIKIRTHLSSNAQLVVIDEAHISLANTYKKAIEYVSAMPNCRIIGLTATPGRSNNMFAQENSILADFFGGKLISIKDAEDSDLKDTISYLQKEKYLAKIIHDPIKINLNDYNDDEIKKIIKNGELDISNINKIVESPIRNKVIVDEIEKALNNSERDLVLVFACNADHCILLQKLLELQGIKSEYVLANTPTESRDKYISEFKKGLLKVLINFGVLTTGFDAPKLKTLIIARHTNSLVVYSQMIGRALRGPLNGGNEENKIIDLIDNIAKLGNPSFLFEYWEDFWGKKLK